MTCLSSGTRDAPTGDGQGGAVGVHAALGVEIPEADYQKVATLDGCVAYLESRLTR
jgi:hypothetical protein